MRVKLHLQPATRAIEQRLEWTFADIEAALLGQGVGIGQAVGRAAGMPAAIRNFHYREAIRRIEFRDAGRAGEPVRRVERFEQEGAPAAGFGRAVRPRFGFLVFVFLVLFSCSSARAIRFSPLREP